jgi:hypothetical protein
MAKSFDRHSFEVKERVAFCFINGRLSDGLTKPRYFGILRKNFGGKEK